MRYLRMVSAALIAAGLVLMCMGAARLDDNTGMREAGAQLEQALKRGDMVRLHIIADDDSDAAQSAKLCVRDALIAAYGERLGQLESRAAALEFLGGELENIEAIAESVLNARGAGYGARAELGECDFPDREYGGVKVPAGRYMALRVELGGARGRNWWCVIYPALCALPPDVPAAEPAGRKVVFYSAVWDWVSGALGL